MRPKFSIIHPTARVPDGWRPSANAWAERCDKPESVEYILCVDACDTDKMLYNNIRFFPESDVVINHSNRSSSAASNCAASLSTGEILVVIADDMFPPEHWDTQLLDLGLDTAKPWLLEISTGGPRDGELILSPILSRALYEKWGYLYWHEYISMYADDDMTAHARQDGVVVQARQFQLDHRHFTYGKSPHDEVYAWQNRSESTAKGIEVFERRKANRFGEVL